MSDLGNKQIMSKNLKKYIELSGKERKEIAQAIGAKYSTFTDWVNGKTYPRIDNVEKLANYFNISKADLSEEENPFNSLGGKLLEIDPTDTDLIDDLKDFIDLTLEQREKTVKYMKLIKSNLL